MLGADRLSGKDCVSDADLLSCPRTANLARKQRVARFSCRSHVEGRIASVEPLDTISSRSPSDYYVYGASGVPTEQISAATGTAIYLYTDQLGSVRMEASATGAVIGTQSYSDYGTLDSSSGTDPSPFGFAGGYTDATGLIYLIHRYYDPATGQFVSVDPLVGVTGAAYGYAGGDPIDYLDPLGLQCMQARGKPIPPELSPAEENAVARKERGAPYNKADYNSAQRKLRTGGKYRGEINVQKRQGNNNFTWVQVSNYPRLSLDPTQLRAVANTLAAGLTALAVIYFILWILAFLAMA